MKEQGRLVVFEEEIALEMMKANAKQEEDKLVLLRIIDKLSKKLSNAESCIYAVEDALNRGSDNDWAQEAIQEFYEKMKEEK